MQFSRIRVKRALTLINNVHGKGTIVDVVWGIPFAGMAHDNGGLVIRQMQYGMDAKPFTVLPANSAVADRVEARVNFLRHVADVPKS